MTNQFIIRKGESKDVETLADFNCRMAEETEGKMLNWETVLAGTINLVNYPKKGFYLVAETQNLLAGSLMITTEWSDWRNKFFYWIQSVYVRPEHRKKGVYRGLYNYLLDFARRKKTVAGIRLYVEKNNTGAKQTYESLGMHDPGYDMYEVLI